MNLFEQDKAYIAPTYKRFPLAIERGKGSLFYDFDGKEYIDLTSGIGVTAFGAADEHWQNAIISQIGKIQHTSNLYYTAPCVRLAQLLCEKTGMKKVFFSNSGAEANECAIKAARKYSAEQKGADCFTILTLDNSFHGRTLTTLAATGQAHYHELFQPLTRGFLYTPANNIDTFLAAAEANKLAGVMIECIQGEGGVVPLEADFVKVVRNYTAANDIPLIVDEVQTGNGRTGRLYAYMNYGITPDIVSTAKGLAGGLPLGATLFGEKLAGVFGYGDHGSTFGGNPVACAAAVSILERIDDALLDEVKVKGEALKAKLLGTEGVTAVTGMGLMLGVAAEAPAGRIVEKAMERGVLCLTAKEKVRLLPALNIPASLLDRAADVIGAAIAEAKKQPAQ